jgi:hypothetical protein
MPGMTITLRVTGPDRNVARVAVRRNQFAIGRPLEFDVTSPRVAALEYALGAAGGEVVNGLREFAARRRLDIDAIEAIVTGELENELAYLEVIGEHGPPRISAITIKVFVAAADDLATRTMFEHTLDRLPLLCTLRAAVKVTTELICTS